MADSSSDPDSLPGAQFTDRDMRKSQFQTVDLRDSEFRFADLRGVRMRAVDLRDVELDGEIEGLRIWGVEVQPLLEAELNRLHPERSVLKATEPADLLAGWTGLEEMWAATVERVGAMPPGTVDVSVDDEWSFAQTLRHLVLATDAWLGRAILGQEHPFHPLGLLFTEGADLAPQLGIDTEAIPSYTDVLDVRAGRQAMVRDYLATVSPEDLAEKRADPWGSGWQPSVLDCLRVVFEEEWHHHRYAVRDLDAIKSGNT